MRPQRQKWFIPLGLLLLPHLLLANIQDASDEMTVISGSNVTLKISNVTHNYKQLAWFYNDNQKIVEQESKGPKYFKSQFKDRVRLGLDHTLFIYNVRKEDSSTYILKVLKESGKEISQYISLKVLDPVPEPVIKIEKIQEESNRCHLKLSCEIEGLSASWYGDSRPFPKEIHSNVLEITVNPQNYSKSYTCQVSNAVSSKNDTVYFTLPCTLDYGHCILLHSSQLTGHASSRLSCHHRPDGTVWRLATRLPSYHRHILRARKRKKHSPCPL
ncbi:CD48 antigen isoform X1 [Felis catus]|uniref:Ig-like domain-containing protein n=1 Tax=Felis catus TaxID=9685 RepID=A0ABI7XTJ8_FELCA|nr:CD48 antigen isoform X1 [Felis catus]